MVVGFLVISHFVCYLRESCETNEIKKSPLQIIRRSVNIYLCLVLTFASAPDFVRSVTGCSSRKLLQKVSPSISTSRSWPRRKKLHCEKYIWPKDVQNEE